MTNVSQKCQYALRAIFELARRKDSPNPTPISEIAKAQEIPPRFLELILVQLKQAGYVESRRGVQGGYFLSVDPGELNVGDVIRLIDGPVGPVKCVMDNHPDQCALYGHCAFLGMWQEARDAVETVYNRTSFRDLIDQHERRQNYTPNYNI